MMLIEFVILVIFFLFLYLKQEAAVRYQNQANQEMIGILEELNTTQKVLTQKLVKLHEETQSAVTQLEDRIALVDDNAAEGLSELFNKITFLESAKYPGAVASSVPSLPFDAGNSI